MASSSEAVGSIKKTSQDGNMIVYTTQTCPRCKMLKEWLRSRNVSFVEKDIGDSEVMADLIVRNIYVLSAPALETRGKVYAESELFNGESINEGLLQKILEEY